MVPRIESFVLSWNSLLLVVVFVTLSALAGLLVDKGLSKLSAWLESRGRLREKHHEIAGHFIGVVGVIYAVLVAFVVVTAWQATDHAKGLTMQEQHDVDDLFHLVAAYHNSKGESIRLMLDSYAKATSDEWDEMKSGEQLCLDTPETCPQSSSAPSRRANRLAHCIREATFDLNPASQQQQVVYEEGIRLVQSLSESREERRHRYQERSLQGILWLSFLLGAVILVLMTYFVEGQSRLLQRTRTTGFFAMIGMVMALAFIFDRPFVGAMQTNGDAWKVMQIHFHDDMRGLTTRETMTANGILASCRD
jgi:cadmium resistance protein CadD (predicted permease)